MLSNDISFLAIDPGDSVGYALFDPQGHVTEFDSIKGHDAFLDWLEQQDGPKVWIIEGYRSRPGKINAWSRLPTVQLIGAIKREARKKNAKIIEQDPSPALNIGLRFLGMSDIYKGKHVPDKVSALAHGTYYLRKAGILK